MINAATGNEAGIKWANVRKWDTKKRLRACVDKARDAVGYDPNTDFEWGLEQTIAWMKDHWDEIEAYNGFGPGASSAVRDMTVTDESKDR